MIALVAVTDGRDDCLDQSIPSALANLQGPVTRRILYDDTGDPAHRAELARKYPTFTLLWHPLGRQGFDGAIRYIWEHLATLPERLVLWNEDDFLYNRPVPLLRMAAVLAANPHLVQLALRRQPWNDQEKAAGGIVEQHPDAYEDQFTAGLGEWLEHRLFFTTNPSLYRTSLCSRSWPAGANSEGRFTHELLAEDPAARFGFWGSRASGEAVTHIGTERAGVGY